SAMGSKGPDVDHLSVREARVHRLDAGDVRLAPRFRRADVLLAAPEPMRGRRRVGPELLGRPPVPRERQRRCHLRLSARVRLHADAARNGEEDLDAAHPGPTDVPPTAPRRRRRTDLAELSYPCPVSRLARRGGTRREAWGRSRSSRARTTSMS